MSASNPIAGVIGKLQELSNFIDAGRGGWRLGRAVERLSEATSEIEDTILHDCEFCCYTNVGQAIDEVAGDMEQCDWEGFYPEIDSDCCLTGSVIKPDDCDVGKWLYVQTYDAMISRDSALESGWAIDETEQTASPAPAVCAADQFC